MIIVVLKWQAKSEEREELIRYVQGMLTLTRGEPGCISSNVFRSSEDENAFTLVEEWENGADLDRHIHRGTFKTLFRIRTLMDGPPDVKIIPVSTRVGQDARPVSCKSNENSFTLP
jgi:quinol monooxygenase YgiN